MTGTAASADEEDNTRPQPDPLLACSDGSNPSGLLQGDGALNRSTTSSTPSVRGSRPQSTSRSTASTTCPRRLRRCLTRIRARCEDRCASCDATTAPSSTGSCTAARETSSSCCTCFPNGPGGCRRQTSRSPRTGGRTSSGGWTPSAGVRLARRARTRRDLSNIAKVGIARIQLKAVVDP
jgi:hypothetical protein